MGNVTPDNRFIQARILAERVINKYEDRKIVATGHSLGGSLALHVVRYFPSIVAIGFNPGTSIVGRCWDMPNQIVRYVNTDVISNMSGWRSCNTGDVKGIDTKLRKCPFYLPNSVKKSCNEMRAHSIDNFTDLEVNYYF